MIGFRTVVAVPAVVRFGSRLAGLALGPADLREVVAALDFADLGQVVVDSDPAVVRPHVVVLHQAADLLAAVVLNLPVPVDRRAADPSLILVVLNRLPARLVRMVLLAKPVALVRTTRLRNPPRTDAFRVVALFPNP